MSFVYSINIRQSEFIADKKWTKWIMVVKWCMEYWQLQTEMNRHKCMYIKKNIRILCFKWHLNQKLKISTVINCGVICLIFFILNLRWYRTPPYCDWKRSAMGLSVTFESVSNDFESRFAFYNLFLSKTFLNIFWSNIVKFVRKTLQEYHGCVKNILRSNYKQALLTKTKLA